MDIPYTAVGQIDDLLSKKTSCLEKLPKREKLQQLIERMRVSASLSKKLREKEFSSRTINGG